MDGNLKLLEKHRQKMWLLVGLIIFMFIYICIIVFWITAVTSWQRIEDENLWVKAERVKNIIVTRNIFFRYGDQDSIDIVRKVLENTQVTDSNWEVLSSLWARYPESQLIKDGIIYENGFKFLYVEFENDSKKYEIVISSDAFNVVQWHLYFILFLILLSPFLYSLLAFIGCRLMHKVYAPIKEIVINLEWFATNVNHEFKTSLTEVLSSLELAKVTKEYEEGVDHAISSAKRLNNILDSLWILVRFVNADYRKTKVNIISMLNESINDYQKEIQAKEIKIIKKYNLDSQIITFIDKEPLLLCFNNILKNAIRYSHEGGRIEILISKHKFVIKDYGIWIDTKNLDKIFERYFRENYNGEWTGIWLSLVKRITERYNWDIQIKSEKNIYTEITLTF